VPPAKIFYFLDNFYVIDYDAPVNEGEEQYKTYFLNQVDETDLSELLEQGEQVRRLFLHRKMSCGGGEHRLSAVRGEDGRVCGEGAGA